MTLTMLLIFSPFAVLSVVGIVFAEIERRKRRGAAATRADLEAIEKRLHDRILEAVSTLNSLATALDVARNDAAAAKGQSDSAMAQVSLYDQRIAKMEKLVAYDHQSRVAADAVAYAEQQSKSLPKRGGAKWHWQDKLDAAVGYFMEHYPNTERRQATLLIEAALGGEKG